MKDQIKIVTLSVVVFMSGLTACSSQAPRITPGTLDVSNNVELHSAKITNIVELSEKEAPDGKMLQGVLAGALLSAAITNNGSNDARDAGAILGGAIGEHLTMKKYGRTIYRLSLALDDGTLKQVHLRGGHYQIGSTSKVTINKSTGEISSFKLVKS